MHPDKHVPVRWRSGLLALALAAPLAASAQQAFTRAGIGLMAGPGNSYPMVAELAEGQPLNVMGCTQGYGWCDVVLPDGLRGWVYAAGLQYPYQGAPVPLPSYGAVIGVPIVTFTIGSYWGNYYRDRPWYGDRRWWGNRPPPPPHAGWRPPPPGVPGWHPRPGPPPPNFRPPRPVWDGGPPRAPEHGPRPPRDPGVHPPRPPGPPNMGRPISTSPDRGGPGPRPGAGPGPGRDGHGNNNNRGRGGGHGGDRGNHGGDRGNHGDRGRGGGGRD